MIRMLTCAVVAGCVTYIAASAYTAVLDREKHNITYNTAEVLSVGQCDNKRCSYSYKTSQGEYRNSVTTEPVSVGQVLYQQCWTERKRGDRCYVTYSPSM